MTVPGPRWDTIGRSESLVPPTPPADTPPAPQPEPVPVPTGVSNTHAVRLAASMQGLILAVIAVLMAFDVWSPTDQQLATVTALYGSLVLVLGEFYTAAKVSSAATVAKIRNGEA